MYSGHMNRKTDQWIRIESPVMDSKILKGTESIIKVIILGKLYYSVINNEIAG